MLAAAVALGWFLVVGDGVRTWFHVLFILPPTAIVALLGYALAHRAVDDRRALSSIFMMALGATLGSLTVFSVLLAVVAGEPAAAAGFFILGAILFGVPSLFATLPASLIWFAALFLEFRSHRPWVSRTVHWSAVVLVVAAAFVIVGRLASADGSETSRGLIDTLLSQLRVEP